MATKKHYYVLVFDNGRVVRCTYATFNTVRGALGEQYGGMTPCVFAMASNKVERDAIAIGKRPAAWFDLYYDSRSRRWAMRQLPDYQLVAEVVQ